jgi:hypothetical protein
MRPRIVGVTVVVLLSLGTLAFAEPKRFEVKADEFDPGKSFMVQGAWLQGIGCPTDATIAVSNATGTGVAGHAPFTDPACPTGDPKDRRVEGLLLVKTGPSANFASAGAKIVGVKGQIISELGWDIRKPDSSNDPRGSHCGAGAPRWNIETRDGESFFLGCNSPAAPVQTSNGSPGWLRMRWGGAVPLLAFQLPTFTLVDIRGKEIKSLSIVFDEGQDTGPDNFGAAILDNIDVNGVLVGRGATDAD